MKPAPIGFLLGTIIATIIGFFYGNSIKKRINKRKNNEGRFNKAVEIKYGRAYANSLKFTMNAEGLFANHPDDKGGMTYQGIARVYNDRWEGWQIIDKYLQQFPELNTPFRKPR